LTAAQALEAAMEKAIQLEKTRKFDEAKYWLNEAANYEKEVLRDKDRPKWGIVARSELILPSFVHCPQCKRRFPREQTIDTSYSYDDGWCHRYEFRCPQCNSELYRMSTNA
jgi:transcription initiation factor IIE alpha subunit